MSEQYKMEQEIKQLKNIIEQDEKVRILAFNEIKQLKEEKSLCGQDYERQIKEVISVFEKERKIHLSLKQKLEKIEKVIIYELDLDLHPNAEDLNTNLEITRILNKLKEILESKE